MNHGSLFSGIGGFDLAAEWMGWNNVFHCEINPFGQKILKHYWPHAISYSDITKTDFSIHRGRIDILTGGFPCQPFSLAGKRKGTEDSRHLWPEMLRAIREIQPKWVVGENVFGIINWSNGLVFEQVQADLEDEGYEVQPYILPACAVNAPHRRDRVWFVAHATSKRWAKQKTEFGKCDGKRESNTLVQSRKQRITSNSEGKRMERIGANGQQKPYTHDEKGLFVCSNTKRYFENFPTQFPVCSRNDGLPAELAGITVSKHRNESIKAYGNAIVPQVALQIFKAIEQYENSKTK